MHQQQWRQRVQEAATRVLVFIATCFLLTACNDHSARSAQPPVDFGIDLKAIDASAKPQNDFHQYVNGTWLKTTPTPPQYGNYGTFTQLTEKAESDLHAIVEQIAAQLLLPELTAAQLDFIVIQQPDYIG